MNLSDFRDKKVLVTGHTGFKGSWLSLWLSMLGSEVIGFSDKLISNPSHFEFIKESIKYDLRGDIRNYQSVKSIINDYKPDFVFHLAAQPIVRKSYEDPLLTWNTNLFGTLNILEALRYMSKKCCAVLITSDKCYENLEWTWGYRENDKLGGPDPYSASKGAAELAIKSYIKSFFTEGKTNIRIASARAGNVIGGGDWAIDRIIPDCIKAWSRGEVLDLRNPNSTRPWQHVLEPLSGYLSLALSLNKKLILHGEAFNFGPISTDTKSVLDLVEEMSKHWDKVNWNISALDNDFHESGLLKLNCDKAYDLLNWRAFLNFQETIKFTVEWYKNFFEDSSEIITLSKMQIETYNKLARLNKIAWAL